MNASWRWICWATGPWWTLLGGAVLGASACTPPFGSCPNAATCGSEPGAGGEGEAAPDDPTNTQDSGHDEGTAASGGAAGTGEAESGGQPGAPAICSSDDDCDDNLACNGGELCLDGNCVAGTPVECANPDPQHCSVACVEADGGSQCAPALLEGLEAGGTPDFLDSQGATNPTLAWSEEAQSFGVAWLRAGSSEVMFAAYDARGVRQVGPVTVASLAATDSRIAIAPGDKGFGVAWFYVHGEVGFRKMLPAGSGSKIERIADRDGDGGLGLAWSSARHAWSMVADHGFATSPWPPRFTRELDAELFIVDSTLAPVPTGFLLAVSATRAGAPDRRVYHYGPGLSGAEPLAFDDTAGDDALLVATRPDGGHAMLLPPVLGAARFYSFGADGQALCSDVQVDVGRGKASSLTASATGYDLALTSTDSSGVMLQQVRSDCSLSRAVSTPFVTSAAKLAASPTSYGLLLPTNGDATIGFFDRISCD